MSALADGHTFWTIEFAKKLCDFFEVRWQDALVTHYKGQQDANPDGHYKGMWLAEDKPTDGVHALRLSYYIASELGVNTRKNPKTGRGFQAQWNARKVRELQQ